MVALKCNLPLSSYGVNQTWDFLSEWLKNNDLHQKIKTEKPIKEDDVIAAI